MNRLKEIALDYLKKYEDAQCIVLDEFSGLADEEKAKIKKEGEEIRKEIGTSKYIDAEELIKWIKESQHMTSKVKSIITMIHVMEGE